jgi:hypothetical protein
MVGISLHQTPQSDFDFYSSGVGVKKSLILRAFVIGEEQHFEKDIECGMSI